MTIQPSTDARAVQRTDPRAERRTSWLELAFDLVFVVAITELGEEFRAELSTAHAVRVAGFYALVFLAWADTTRAMNHLVDDGALRRVLVLVQIQAFAAAAWLLPAAVDGSVRGIAAALLVARTAVAVEYVRSLRHLASDREALLVEVAGASTGALLLVAAAVSAWPGWLVGAALASLVGPLGRPERYAAQLPAHAGHLSERYGLFALIVLGDALAEAVGALTERSPGIDAGVVVVAALSVGAAVWWAYYDRVDDRRLRTGGRWPAVWVGVHLLIFLGTTLLGAATHRLIDHGLLDAPDRSDTAVLGLGMALIWAGLALVNQLADPSRPGVARRQTGTAAITLLVIAAAPALPLAAVLAVTAAAALVAAREPRGTAAPRASSGPSLE